MNYMEQVAKMLRVELGQLFEICGRYGTYFLSYDGLYQVEGGCKVEYMLSNLLSGECKIKHKPWKPSYSEHYYHIGKHGNVLCDQWYEDIIDLFCYKTGNCYHTKEAAEENISKWVSFYASNEVLEV